MLKLNKSFWWILAAVAATGCAPLGSSSYDPGPKPMVYAFNAVKLLSPDITAVNDPSTMQQTSYPVGTNNHLLLRFKDLLGHATAVLTDDKNRVQVQVTVLGDGAVVTAAVDAVSICPMTRQFFMSATWTGAYPFNHSGLWQHEGGDYDDTGCVKGAVSQTDKQAILFDVTQWFIDYPRARGANFGLILISTKDVTVAGNASGGEYPRLLWSE